MRSLTTIIIVGAIVLVVAVGILVRNQELSSNPEQPVQVQLPGQRPDRAARRPRVEQRLQRLRESRQTGERFRESRRTGERRPEGKLSAPRRPEPRREARAPLPTAAPRARGGRHINTGDNADLEIAELEDTIRNDPDPEERASAIFFLSGEDEQIVLPVLIDAMNDPDKEVRLAVVEALGDYSDEISPEVVLPALNDVDAEVRFEALGVLGDMEGPVAREAALRMLNDPDGDVRELADGILEMESAP